MIMISSCDAKFFSRAKRTYASFKRFNNTKMYFGNVDCSGDQLRFLESLGVIILTTNKIEILKKNKLSFRFLDWLLYDFLRDVDYDKVMWIDSDVMILRNIESLFSIDADFIGHPGRNKDGAIMTEDGIPYVTPSLWVTRRKDFLEALSLKVNNLYNQPGEGQHIRSVIKDLGLSVHQLDPSIWNFGRDLVEKSRLDETGLYYKVYPATIGFNVRDDGTRGYSEEIEKWYKKHIDSH